MQKWGVGLNLNLYQRKRVREGLGAHINIGNVWMRSTMNRHLGSYILSQNLVYTSPSN